MSPYSRITRSLAPENHKGHNCFLSSTGRWYSVRNLMRFLTTMYSTARTARKITQPTTTAPRYSCRNPVFIVLHSAR